MTGNMILLWIVLLPLLAGVACYLICRRTGRMETVIAVAGAELLLVLLAVLSSPGEVLSFSMEGICSMGISLMLDDFRRVYAVVVCFMWFMTLLLSRQYFGHDHNPARYFLFNLLTLGGTLGVFLSADLFTTFIFFELISLTSYAWVAHEENPGALRAADTYLAVAVIGGLTALMGLFLLQHNLGTLVISQLRDAAAACENKAVLYAAGGCLLVGFGAKAGIYPLHIWLPKAHPVAPAPASALLSGILTKCGVFGVVAVSATVFWGDHGWGSLLLGLGTITMVLGALLGLLSVDLKRTLACSSMSQIGFIVVGIAMSCLLGEHNALASRGAMLHMLNHSLFKLILFMAAGTVYMNVHKLNLNDIRGFGRNKPFLHAVFLMGALGIGGIPGWSGYISKTLLHESIVEFAAEHPSVWITGAEWLFLFSGGLTLAYMTKLYVAIFVEKHPTRQAEFDAMKNYASLPTRIALGGSAILIPVLGALPHNTMDILAERSMGFFAGGELHHAVHYFNLTNLKGAVISVTIGALVYLLVARKLLMQDGAYVDRLNGRFDLEDNIYRPLLLQWLPELFGRLTAVFGENQVLTPLVTKVCPKVFGSLAVMIGENKILTPIFSKALLGGGIELRLLTEEKEVTAEEELPYDDERNTTPYKLGSLIDQGYSATHHHEQPVHPMATTFVRLYSALQHATSRITRNLSFSLLMICVGLCLLLLYMLLY